MNTKEKIEIMQAYVEGKTVQNKKRCSPEANWKDYTSCNEPYWNWGEFDYRIKPEVLYLNVYTLFKADHLVIWKSGERPKPAPSSGCIGYLEDKQDGSPIVFHKD